MFLHDLDGFFILKLGLVIIIHFNNVIWLRAFLMCRKNNTTKMHKGNAQMRFFKQ